MIAWLELTFWVSLLCIGYIYFGYPLLVYVAASLLGRPLRPEGPLPRSLSIVVAAHNEEAYIVRRIRELTDQIAATGITGEVIVVSDGSTDHTASLARAQETPFIHVVELEVNEGKAAALSAGCAEASGEVLVFADARQTWAPDALKNLLRNFRDPTVGAISGNLLLEPAPGILTGVGAYWRYEKCLRFHESRLHSLIGATGAISACRRNLFKPVPKGTILDDVYWPLQVAMQRRRVVHEPEAIAHDRLPTSPADEFRRKLRTLCGNFQLLMLCPGACLPWRNPVWLQLLSHKFLRLLAPWGLLSTLIASAALSGPLYRIVFFAQLSLYALGLLGLQNDTRHRLTLTRTAASFLILNGAAWLAFWMWLLGRTEKTWRKITYHPPALEYSQHP